MRRSRFILPLLLFFCLAAATGPLKPKNFQYARTLPGPLKPGNIYRIILPGEVLNHTTIDQRDIRVFSPDETLIPFTILREHKPAVSRAQSISENQSPSVPVTTEKTGPPFSMRVFLISVKM